MYPYVSLLFFSSDENDFFFFHFKYMLNLKIIVAIIFNKRQSQNADRKMSSPNFQNLNIFE